MKIRPSMFLLFLSGFTGTALAEDAAKPRAFDSDGVKIQYTVDGRGLPVVLVHGLYSSADMNWRLPGTIKALATHYQVIAFDVRGHGHSDKPDKEEAYGDEMAEDVVRLLDHLKIEKAHIVGYSMGGMIAMKVVTTHPDRVHSVTLGGMGWLKEGSRLQDFWENIRDRDGAKTPSACLRSLGKLAVTEQDLKAIRVPVSILIGDRDPVRRMYVAPLQRVRDDWPVTVIQGAGHINCIALKQFKDELEKALDKHSR
jgi:pimeloyl-ACP methyl ester carboxylesterase